MTVVIDLYKTKQILKIPDGELEISSPEPFFFVAKMDGRKFSDQQLHEIDVANEHLRIETNADGDFEISLPSFLEISRKNAIINYQIASWAKTDESGVCFSSSAKFTLPNGAKRMPDAAWILKDRYYAFSENERGESFTKIAPDFVIELRSKSDRLPILQNKMEEYIENGGRLGWLIDPYEKCVHIYRQNGEVEILENPKKVSGEDVLQRFELDLAEIF